MRRHHIDFHADPACGWSQTAHRWLVAAARVRPFTFMLRPYSLLLRDGTDGIAEVRVQRRLASLRALRVIEAARWERPELVPCLWEQVVAQEGPAPFADLRGADVAAGGAPRWAAAADDAAIADAIRASMAGADAVLGPSPVLPALIIDGSCGFTGPLLSDALTPAAAGALWDAVVTLAATPGFKEVTRVEEAVSA
jgi:hypothetical protein